MKKGLPLILIVVTGLITSLLTACGGAGSGASSNEVKSGAGSRELSEQEAARPLFPAAIDEDFREDSAASVGTTGRPQLVEVFHYN